MLTDVELERYFLNLGISRAGRDLITTARKQSPVRDVQQSSTVRTRFVSRKMDRALLAESHTVEFPGLYFREFDKETLEYWPQPFNLSLKVEAPSGAVTRVPHVPDLLVLRESEVVVEEWREEKRLRRLAAQYPHRYRKVDGRWHDSYAEALLGPMNIRYHLRSADEHPRIWLANLGLLEDYTLETAAPVPNAERQRLLDLLQEERKVNYLDLLHHHGFNADDVMQTVLLQDVYVDLKERRISETQDLVIYADEATGRADAILQQASLHTFPDCVLNIEPGAEFLYGGNMHRIVLVGDKDVQARTAGGQLITLMLSEITQMVKDRLIVPTGAHAVNREFNEKALLKSKKLPAAVKRLHALKNPKASGVPARTLRKWRDRIAGLQTEEAMLEALMDSHDGNRNSALTDASLEKMQEAVDSFHNKENAPTKQATFDVYVELCAAAGIESMSRSTFFERIGKLEDHKSRYGTKRDYQDAELPWYAEYREPVNGHLPHGVAYMDHTPLPQMLRGLKFGNLGKPTLTLMTDGAVSCPRAFFLSFKNARTYSVLMCLRDYVRRHGVLPRILVVDNGKEFHSHELEAFADIFKFTIRWRRPSKPRDSAVVESALGITQREVTDLLMGTSKELQKNARSVSATHAPDKHIEWTLKALHGSLNNYFFTTLMQRVHPVHGMTPLEYEQKLNFELGSRSHRAIAYNGLFRILSAPSPKRRHPRKLDRRRGVWVDRAWYWHPELAKARPKEYARVKTEPFNAQVIYVEFRGEWLIAKSREPALFGRYLSEVEEYQKRHERMEAGNAAQRDRKTIRHVQHRVASWIDPTKWDDRLREQNAEEQRIYANLGMAEAMPEAANPVPQELILGVPKRSAAVSPADVEQDSGESKPVRAVKRPVSTKPAPADKRLAVYVTDEPTVEEADVEDDEDYEEEQF
ncbi:transposase family protein [Roseateles sp.]|uniref:integrase catalytic domain-containing protein n=1 Tax=Roseateles sp. TaxID=1971397 RepID=UPI0031D55BBB